jgi:hypothetical protein
MYIWSFILLLNPVTVAMQQLPSPEGYVSLRISELEQQRCTVQCTIYNSSMEPVRMIPLQGGHFKGEYTLQVKSLPPGAYSVRVGQQELDINLK